MIAVRHASGIPDTVGIEEIGVFSEVCFVTHLVKIENFAGDRFAIAENAVAVRLVCQIPSRTSAEDEFESAVKEVFVLGFGSERDVPQGVPAVG
ncbi:MAG: hypothetical protein IKT50_04235, partial [Clostridia bacterium]|nr:hypothetical protein [Clostridia bacterium]